MKTSTVFFATVTCTVLFSAWLFDHSPTPMLVQSACIVSVLLLMLSLLITYAVHVHVKYTSAQALARRREQLMNLHYPHVADFNRRAKMLHKVSTSGNLKSRSKKVV